MTISIQPLPPHCVEIITSTKNTSTSTGTCCMDMSNDTTNYDYQWPDQFAKNISDKVHRQVKCMLAESRLTRKSANEIHLIRHGEIVSVDRVLGSGAFSKVSAVTTNDGRRYACKHLRQNLMEKPEDFQLAAAELALEAHILSSFDHPNILKIRGWAANGIASFENGKHDSFFLMLDLLQETLDQRIERWRNQELQSMGSDIITTTTVASMSTACTSPTIHTNATLTAYHHTLYLEKIRIMTEIASALEYIHLQGVVFRDLKPTNIGFSAEKNTVQIFDFGLSRELPSLDTSTPFSMSGKVGTLRYMAPEVAAHQPYNISSDVYSWAIVSYEILSLVKPFFGWTRDLHADLVCNRGIRPETTNTIHPISTEMVVLLEQSWSSVPSNRGSMSQIGVQLQCLLSSQVSYLNDHQQRQTDYQEQQQHQQQHQQHQRQFLDQQQQQQEQPVNTNTIDGGGFYIDNMPSCMLTYPPTALIVSKLTRRMSFETIETINTSSLSLDSINYF